MPVGIFLKKAFRGLDNRKLVGSVESLADTIIADVMGQEYVATCLVLI